MTHQMTKQALALRAAQESLNGMLAAQAALRDLTATVDASEAQAFSSDVHGLVMELSSKRDDLTKRMGSEIERARQEHFEKVKAFAYALDPVAVALPNGKYRCKMTGKGITKGYIDLQGAKSFIFDGGNLFECALIFTDAKNRNRTETLQLSENQNYHLI